MPKQKTHSGTKDRFKITKNGKVQRKHAMTGHNLSKKSAARKRRFAGYTTVDTPKVSRSIKKNLGV
ncbi:MAG: 50S ribosomal protein L35 [bacterium]|nr:50S ribosomal protein L35 [bacterium]